MLNWNNLGTTIQLPKDLAAVNHEVQRQWAIIQISGIAVIVHQTSSQAGHKVVLQYSTPPPSFGLENQGITQNSNPYGDYCSTEYQNCLACLVEPTRQLSNSDHLSLFTASFPSPQGFKGWIASPTVEPRLSRFANPGPRFSWIFISHILCLQLNLLPSNYVTKLQAQFVSLQSTNLHVFLSHMHPTITNTAHFTELWLPQTYPLAEWNLIYSCLNYPVLLLAY